MKTKLIAIGNTIMKDDGIGIKVAEELTEVLKKYGVESIIGETDIEYCLSAIEEGDFLFILDASLQGRAPGTVCMKKIEKEQHSFAKVATGHEVSIITLLNSPSIEKVQGYSIEIEVHTIDFGTEFSDIVLEKFEQIVEQVKTLIIFKLEELKGGRNCEKQKFI